MMLAQCVCPSRAQEQRTKDPLPATTWDETLFLLVVVAVVAVLVWEGLRWMQRRALRCYKRWKKGRKLDVVSRLASSAARKEIAAANQARTDETSSSLRRRRTFSPHSNTGGDYRNLQAYVTVEYATDSANSELDEDSKLAYNTASAAAELFFFSEACNPSAFAEIRKARRRCRTATSL